MGDERFDGLLLTMCQGLNDMDAILNTFFSFLRRKTDFYHVLEGNEKVGFPPGVAEKMLIRAFRRYQEQTHLAPSTARLEEGLEARDAAKQKKGTTPVSGSGAAGRASNSGKKDEPKQAATLGAEPQANCPSSAVAPAPAAPRQEGISTYNGTEDNGYSWAQTATDVTVQLFFPPGTTAKMLDVKIGKKKLKVGLKGGETRLDGELFEAVAVDECTWNIDRACGELTVSLEKASERWWKSALVGGKEIDTTKVDSTKSIDEYDGETQGAIRKLMWEQEQKAMGKKTDEEVRQEELLRQAWDAPGSPFAGQPFDPSAVNWGGSAPGACDAAAAGVGQKASKES